MSDRELHVYILSCLVCCCFRFSFCQVYVNHSTHNELRRLCLIIALPGRTSGPELDVFSALYNDQLFKAGNYIYSEIDNNEARLNHSEVTCNMFDTTRPECAYLRLYKVGQYLKNDLDRLTNVISSVDDKRSHKLSFLLLAWYLDPVLLKLNCGPVDIKSKVPAAQWVYASEFYNIMANRSNVCSWTQPFRDNIAQHLRSEVTLRCLVIPDDPFCQLEPFFELIESIEKLCDLVQEVDWQESSLEIMSAKFAIFTLFQGAPNKLVHDRNINEERKEISEIVRQIFKVFYDEFKAKNLKNTAILIKILPKSASIRCNFMAKYPSFDWLLCAFSKTLDQIRSFILTYGTGTSSLNSKRKILVASVNYKEYIQNSRISRIQEFAEEISLDLQAMSVEIKHDIQNRFQQLGSYFKSVAEFESKKISADISSIKADINSYRNTYEDARQKLKYKLAGLMLAFTSAAVSDLAEAIAKLTIRAAEASNPLKWIFNSGNAAEVLEAVTDVAQATSVVAKAFSKVGYLIKLQKQTSKVSKKIDENAPLLRTIGNLVNSDNLDSVSDEEFSRKQSEFLKLYDSYSGKLKKYELSRLSSYWEGFIDDVCSSLEETSSAPSAAFKTTVYATNACPDSKAYAVQLVVSLEEIFDFQETLIEKMASFMRSYTQMQSATILGSGARANYPANLTLVEIQSFAAAAYVTNSIVQFTSVVMLCDILEYKQGVRPNECQGFSTNVDKLLSIQDINCHSILKYVDLPTLSPTNGDEELTNNMSLYDQVDLKELYTGSGILFKVPNTQWLIDNGWILESQKNFAFFIEGFEVYIPIYTNNTIQVIK